MKASHESQHYHTVKDAYVVDSNAVLSRMHNYVNIAKALFTQGVTSNGRTLNFTFVAKKSKLIVIGQNDYRRIMDKYVPLLKSNYKRYGEKSYIPSLHSEMSAVLRIGSEDCSEYDFYNIRIDKNKHCRNSAPCANCLRVLNIVGFKHLYFYDDNMQICQL